MERHLAAANRLTNSLGSENVQWRAKVMKLQEERRQLLGDCVVSAAFLTYTGAFSYNFRQRMLHNDWLPDLQNRQIPRSQEFKLTHFLTDETTVAIWKDAGLPDDELSVQNGIIAARASRFPILIDPQQQALNWVKNLEAKNNLRVATFEDQDFLKHLELSIKLGTPFLFENVCNSIDPIVHNVLSKNILREEVVKNTC